MVVMHLCVCCIKHADFPRVYATHPEASLSGNIWIFYVSKPCLRGVCLALVQETKGRCLFVPSSTTELISNLETPCVQFTKAEPAPMSHGVFQPSPREWKILPFTWRQLSGRAIYKKRGPSFEGIFSSWLWASYRVKFLFTECAKILSSLVAYGECIVLYV